MGLEKKQELGPKERLEIRAQPQLPAACAAENLRTSGTVGTETPRFPGQPGFPGCERASAAASRSLFNTQLQKP